MSEQITDYEEFLRQKILTLPATGFTKDIVLSPDMKDFQAAGTAWALRRGRAALFFDTGLGKGYCEGEWCRQVADETKGLVILFAPFAVSEQFVHRELPKFGIPCKLVEQQSDCALGLVNVTNYEKLHRFEPQAFAGVCIDESSCLKGLDSAITTKLITSFSGTLYRLAASATPSPNDVEELGNHAEFLGIMTRSEMLATFFTHDSGSSSTWRLKEHAKAAFWRWVAGWALMAKKPSDLGFDDGGYDLPGLNMHEHVVAMPQQFAREQGTIVPVEAKTLTERRKAKRASLSKRVEACAALVNDSKDQFTIWCHLNDESEALHKAIPGSVQIAGKDDPEDKKNRMLAFAEGKIRVLITKARIAGFGLNFQNCHKTAFVGLNESHEQFYQCVRRHHRFGQTSIVDVHLFMSDAETATLRDLKRKEEQAQEMSREMVKATREVSREQITGAVKEVEPYKRDVARGKRYTFHLGDSCDVIRETPDNSVDYSIQSPAFESLYTFSNSERDMGNCTSGEEFAEHFRFLARESLRVTKPGRLMSLHCMDLPMLKSRDGVIGIKDFPGRLIKVCEQEGWILHSRTTIFKDPVAAMYRTKAHGLMRGNVMKDSTAGRTNIPDTLLNLYKPGEADACVAGDYANALRGFAALAQGNTVSLTDERALRMYMRLWEDMMPSYLLSWRKRGENAKPVKHKDDEMSVEQWAHIASPIWMDIRATDTLNTSDARAATADEDEKHISLLQLEVIRRGIWLYSNPGETVASWFGGIGSEGVIALELGRDALLCELKESYFRQGAKNLAAAEAGPPQLALF
jgi:hypothetical protein